MTGNKKPCKTKRVVGLAYDTSKGDAPTITVKGNYLYGEDLIKIARRYGVPVIERKEVVRALEAFEEGEEIPEHLYEAVALILNELEGKG